MSSPKTENVFMTAREAVFARRHKQRQRHDRLRLGDHFHGQVADIPLGVAVGPETGDVVEFPGVDLHKDPFAVGVGQGIVGGGRNGTGEFPV